MRGPTAPNGDGKRHDILDMIYRILPDYGHGNDWSGLRFGVVVVRREVAEA
jgi:hypothetical protein